MNLPDEIIYNILLPIPYEAVMNYCRTNTIANHICNDDYFWKLKLERDFYKVTNQNLQLSPSQYVMKYDHSSMGGHDTYLRWKNKWREYNDSVSIFKILYDLGGTKNTDISIFLWEYINNEIFKHDDLNNKYISPYSKLFQTEEIDNLDLYNWFYEKGSYPTYDDMINPLWYDRIDILDWLEQHGVHPIQNYSIDMRSASVAWLLKRNILPNQTSVNNVLIGGTINLLNKIAQHGIIPDEIGANKALQLKNIKWDNIRWLANKGIVPDEKGVNCLLMQQISHVDEDDILNALCLLGKYSIFPNQYAAGRALIFKKYKVIDWLVQHNIIPDSYSISMAIESEGPDIKRWIDIHIKHLDTVLSNEQFPPPNSDPNIIHQIKIRNPLTGRLITKNGILYNKLVRQGIIFSHDNI